VVGNAGLFLSKTSIVIVDSRTAVIIRIHDACRFFIDALNLLLHRSYNI